MDWLTKLLHWSLLVSEIRARYDSERDLRLTHLTTKVRAPPMSRRNIIEMVYRGGSRPRKGAMARPPLFIRPWWYKQFKNGWLSMVGYGQLRQYLLYKKLFPRHLVIGKSTRTLYISTCNYDFGPTRQVKQANKSVRY